MNILLIEDEPKVAAFIKKGLENFQHTVTVAYDGQDGYHAAMQQDFSVVILDRLLPTLSGLDVCRRIKHMKKGLPILMLTALGTVQDIVQGFENGADDYLTKPFHFDELMARIQALHRRGMTLNPGAVYQVADLVMDCYNHIVKRGEKEIALTVKEYSLLEVFMTNKNRVLTRTYLAETVWGINFSRGTNLIDVYVNYLRSKVDKGFDTPLIQTVVGVGYVMRDK
ncbi:response regulator transcription factor [Chitinophaga sp. Cy-1792]|uniref:response regulator transcription factor n=1 Tax=Chitinophaga sp. Cy-1792 TaxID=2608339 RepID=UPI0014203AA7|nr:response regulator transcription factor [Chitinophaga sp. Cy-1792]NIG54416.1 response regulator transcription factor [Chitinophaga sp. Cy-1792]